MFPGQQINPMMMGMGGQLPQPDTSYIDLEQRTAQQQMQQPSRAMPEMFNEGLNYLDDNVDQYYSTYNRLNNFAQTLWKNYSIDVTAPDPSDERAVLASKLFNKYLTEMQVLGNRLKTSQSDMNMIRNARVQGLIEGEPGSDYESSMEGMYNTRVLPEVEQANKILQQGWYDENQRESHDNIYKAAKANLDRMYSQARTPGERERIIRAQEQLVNPFQTAPDSGAMTSMLRADNRSKMLKQRILSNNGILGLFGGNTIAASQMLRSADGTSTPIITSDGRVVVRELMPEDGSYRVTREIDLTNPDGFSDLISAWNENSINVNDQMNPYEIEEFVDKNWNTITSSIPGLSAILPADVSDISASDKVALVSNAMAKIAQDKYGETRKNKENLMSAVSSFSEKNFDDKGRFNESAVDKKDLERLEAGIRKAYSIKGESVMIPAGSTTGTGVAKMRGNYTESLLPEDDVVGVDSKGVYVRVQSKDALVGRTKFYITNEREMQKLASIDGNEWFIDLVSNLYKSKTPQQAQSTQGAQRPSETDAFFNE